MAYQVQPGLNNEERLLLIDQRTGEMQERLFGNGQPGEIEKLQKRVTSVEAWLWRAVGAGSLLGLALEFLRTSK